MHNLHYDLLIQIDTDDKLLWYTSYKKMESKEKKIPYDIIQNKYISSQLYSYVLQAQWYSTDLQLLFQGWNITVQAWSSTISKWKYISYDFFIVNHLLVYKLKIGLHLNDDRTSTLCLKIDFKALKRVIFLSFFD